MPTSVTMPQLGESVTEGTISRWLKAVGDLVAANEPLVEVSTDKVDTEVVSPAAGVLLLIAVGEEETVDVGVEIAVIGAPDAEVPAANGVVEPEPLAPAAAAVDPTSDPAPAPSPAHPPVSKAATSLGADALGGVGPEYLTPLVRKLAKENSVELKTLTGTGLGGRIRKSDVIAAASGTSGSNAPVPPSPVPVTAPTFPAAAVQPAAPPNTRPVDSPTPTAVAAPSHTPAVPAPAGVRVEKLSRLRQVIASRMVESLQVSAQLTTVVEVDVSGIAKLRRAAKVDFERREGVKLSFLPFFVSAAIEALKLHPVVNSSINSTENTVTFHDAVHMGIAVDSDRGLMVPVITDAGGLNLAGLARRIADLADRTRTGRIGADELGGGTFTVTNTGSRGALFDTPIINQPQVAILGTGTVVKRSVVIDDPVLGEITAVRSMVYLALSYDHRIVDGADAARFLSTMKALLEAASYDRELGLI